MAGDELNAIDGNIQLSLTFLHAYEHALNACSIQCLPFDCVSYIYNQHAMRNHYATATTALRGAPMLLLVSVSFISGLLKTLQSTWGRGFVMFSAKMCLEITDSQSPPFWQTRVHDQGDDVFPKGLHDRAPNVLLYWEKKCSSRFR